MKASVPRHRPASSPMALLVGRMPQEAVLQALGVAHETCRVDKIYYYASRMDLCCSAIQTCYCADGAAFVWPDMESDSFLILKHVGAPAAGDMLVVTQAGMAGRITVEGLTPQQLLLQLWPQATDGADTPSGDVHKRDHWSVMPFGPREGACLAELESQLTRLWMILSDCIDLRSDGDIVSLHGKSPGAVVDQERTRRVLGAVATTLELALASGFVQGLAPGARRAHLLALSHYLVSSEETQVGIDEGIIRPALAMDYGLQEQWAVAVGEIRRLQAVLDKGMTQTLASWPALAIDV